MTQETFQTELEAKCAAQQKELESLRTAQEQIDRFFELSLDMLCISSSDGYFKRLSPAFTKTLGWPLEELLIRPYIDFVHPDDLEATIAEVHRQAQRGEKVYQFENRYLHQDGSYRVLSWMSMPQPDGLMYATARDVTEVKKAENRIAELNANLLAQADELRAAKEQLEEHVLERTAELISANEKLIEEIEERKSLQTQLLQSQKMESLGSLAGGVAHDFNNLLTAILGYTELAQMKLPTDSAIQPDLKEIHKAGLRAAALTKQLLTFARKEVVEPKVVNLNDVVQGLEKLLQPILGERVEMIQVLASDLGNVKIDPSQFEQVIINLAVNARDAMTAGGKLVIGTRNETILEAQQAHKSELSPGEYVVLSISDNGMGMTPEIQAQVFDPFFTTKQKGSGTGLGLSTCYGIVHNNNGRIRIYSEPGTGTTIRIYLPVVNAPTHDLALDTEFDDSAHGETILVVEDEETVRLLTATVLRAKGYVVLEAGNGAEALHLVAKHEGKIDLLVTDVVMPGMGGRELAQLMSTVRPETHVLFTSGYTDDAMVHQGVMNEGLPFLQKPFAAAQITRKVRDLLDKPIAA